MKTLLVKCTSVQWQPGGLTIHAKKWFLGAGFLGAPPISFTYDLSFRADEPDAAAREANPLKNYYLLGTNSVIDQMKAGGASEPLWGTGGFRKKSG